MMPRLIELVFDAEIVERQRLLNGAELVSLEGRSVGGAEDWSLALNYTRPKEAGAAASEGDLSLESPAGSLQAGLDSGTIEVVLDDIAGDEQQLISLALRIDDGDGAFQQATGSVRIQGTLTGDLARLELTVEIQ